MANAYEQVEYFDSGPDARAAISLAADNLVNKYHMIPMQHQVEYSNKTKALSKNSVNIALPDVFEQEDEEGVVGSTVRVLLKADVPGGDTAPTLMQVIN